MTAAVLLEAVDYSYPDGTRALHEITLSVAKGSRVGVVGPNGAGKTTLLLVLAGLYQPIRGRIFVGESSREGTAVDSRFSVLFQDPDDQVIFPRVLDDVAFGLRIERCEEERAQRKAREMLRTIGIEALEHRHPARLSGGEKRLVALAGALVTAPRFLLLDEPSSGLDPRARRRIIEFLRSRKETLIVATHDLELVLELCPRTVLLDEGRIVADGATSEIMQNGPLLTRHGLEIPYSLRREHIHPIMPDDPHHRRHHEEGIPHTHGA
ncbi:MAG: ABC transporter ATP-binding protein [Candidatus Hydrogenedentota bacterium]|nr:MAG: ABC transporter ATP-binding protein [Candidatus Hydrogenedentota bacterium]